MSIFSFGTSGLYNPDTYNLGAPDGQVLYGSGGGGFSGSIDPVTGQLGDWLLLLPQNGQLSPNGANGIVIIDW
jgi:hypothetical protein